jgi:hypothetical protein
MAPIIMKISIDDTSYVFRPQCFIVTTLQYRITMFEQFIPTNAHRHTMSIVTFINSFPQYVFRRAYIAIFRESLKFSNIDQYL